ncbi:MAG: hypothetical protein HYX94_04670 [Chloroflexi bacterium]|nr:hypothetical protein [Chloroflexota bacterium]
MGKLLGEYLRENFGLTCHQIVLGLRHQVIRRDAGTYVPLGEALISLGCITDEQLALALEQQRGDLSAEVIGGLSERPEVRPIVYLQ